ncbi:uncharacterized protein Dvir_GJ26257 [Drosophila virilis]|uniref:Uncharacterized protein n=1 Tax=Drosophila virilis TaxID=7244 RepID=A0A0Q9WD07_DROVI|nr:uncharacterized protein LOC26530914 isoform X3 [Drosophila virilis]KRF82525.1 uncharacterized protein Dvir_GJ26257 [Drosophila virilis]
MLRKHLATYTSMLNVKDVQIDRLANFMGHHKDLHKEIYRIPVTVAEIAEVSQMLMAALGNKVEDENTVALDQLEENDPLEDSESDYSEQRSESDFNISDNEIVEKSNKREKRPSSSSFGKTIRNRWSNEEREEIYQRSYK